MVYIDILQNDLFITLNCHKGSENGEFFQIIIDSQTKQVIKKPSNPDIDVSTAYSHVYALLRDGKQLPAQTVAAWG